MNHMKDQSRAEWQRKKIKLPKDPKLPDFVNGLFIFCNGFETETVHFFLSL
jgi:hypothetical protein